MTKLGTSLAALLVSGTLGAATLAHAKPIELTITDDVESAMNCFELEIYQMFDIRHPQDAVIREWNINLIGYWLVTYHGKSKDVLKGIADKTILKQENNREKGLKFKDVYKVENLDGCCDFVKKVKQLLSTS